MNMENRDRRIIISYKINVDTTFCK